MVRKVTLQPKI